MRKDMHKVIVERPRHGHWMKNKTNKSNFRVKHKKNIDDGFVHQSMSGIKQFGYSSKELNEHLSPLKRFLARAVGRPWDNVWSEICSVVSSDTAVLKHVRDHVKGYVFTDAAFDENGTPHDPRVGHDVSSIVHMFYVDSQGILIRTPVKWTKQAYKERRDKVDNQHKKSFKKTDDGKVFCRIENVWFEVSYEILDTRFSHAWIMSKKIDSEIIKILALNISLGFHERVFNINKRQASKKQIKLYDLNEESDNS